MGGFEICEKEVVNCQPHEWRDELIELSQIHIKDQSLAPLIYTIPTRLRQKVVLLRLTSDGGFLPFMGTVTDLAAEIGTTDMDQGTLTSFASGALTHHASRIWNVTDTAGALRWIAWEDPDWTMDDIQATADAKRLKERIEK